MFQYFAIETVLYVFVIQSNGRGKDLMFEGKANSG